MPQSEVPLPPQAPVPDKREIVRLLSNEANQQELFRRADAVRKENVGDEVHLRGLIEFSNICRNNCLYCGIRRGNTHVCRYRMDEAELVEIARKEGAVAICHGATGKGNDQIRFELGIKALAPDLKIIAAWRNDKWTMDSRESEIEYCQAHGIHLPFSADSSYSRDRNIWHISHEGLELEDPANEPNYGHLLVLGCTPEEAPDEAEYVTMTFEKGVPKSVNGVEMKVSDIIRTLNKLGAKHGIGIVDIVENRVVGMKSRGVYETPGGTILMEAHQQLEELILDRDTYAEKIDMGNKMAQIVYEGKWFTPLREAVQAFVEKTQEYVTGEVKFKLYKGNIIKAGTTSPYSLYNESLASFTTGDLYDHHDAEGFINLFGLSSKVRAMKMQEVEKNNN